MESEFRDNYKELKLAFERLKILKVCLNYAVTVPVVFSQEMLAPLLA